MSEGGLRRDSGTERRAIESMSKDETKSFDNFVIAKSPAVAFSSEERR